MSHLRLISSCCLPLLIWGTPVRGEPDAASSRPEATTKAGPSAKVEALCDEAERALSIECAASLGRELCGDTTGRSQLATKARAGLKLVSEARNLVEKHPDSEDSPGDESAGRLERLEQFGEVFACIGEFDESEQSRRKLIAACGPLAAYFDDPDASISEAAKLWQGMAYRRAGRVDRALQVLRPVLSKPVDTELGFWLRVERCRALADRGDATAGITLCLRLEKRVVDWFDEETKDRRGAAQNTLRQLRANLWNRWSQQLKEAGKTKDADATAAEARTLGESILRVSENDRCLSLTHALPPRSSADATSEPTP